jgi:hypothetical protein
MRRPLVHHCFGSGRLVASESSIPSAPEDYAWSAALDRCGCNHLRCEECGGLVRSFAADPGERRYACGCTEYLVDSAVRLGLPEDAYFVRPAPTGWSCHGHPARDLPATLEGVEVGAEPAWREWLGRSARGELPREGLAPWMPGHAHAWLERLVATVSPAERQRFADAAASVVAGPEDAAGTEARAVWGVAADLSERLGLPSVAVRLAGSISTGGFDWDADPRRTRDAIGLLEVAGDARPGDGAVIAAMRVALRSAPNASGLLARVAKVDPAWLADEAVTLVRRQPAYEATLLRVLGEAGAVDDLRQAVHNLARGGVGSRDELVRAVHRGLPEAERERMLAELDGLAKPDAPSGAAGETEGAE